MNFITDYSAADRIEWIRFVQGHPHGNVFHFPEMISVYENTPGYKPVVVFAIKNNSLVGIMAGVIISTEKKLNRFLTSRCVVTGGPLVKDSDAKVAEGLIRKFTEEAKSRTVYIQVRNINDQGALKKIFIMHGYRYEDHLDIEIKLSESFEVLEKRMHDSRRRNVAKAYRKGVRVRRLNTTDEILEGYRVVTATYRRVKIPGPPESLFKAISVILVPKGLAQCYGIFYEGGMIGFRVVLTWGRTIYDYYAGSHSDHSNKYPNDVLLNAILREGCEGNFGKFIFGGAGKPGKKYGVRDYKMKFGGKLVNYGRFTRINKPVIYWPAAIIFRMLRFLSGES